MASSRDALRRQRRRELDARRSKSRVRLGACLPRWGQLKDSLGFTLHSELAQYLLESYFSKTGTKCSCSKEESAIMASAEALDRLVQLVHSHGQWCPHPPSLQVQSAAGKAGSDPCLEPRCRPGRKPERGTGASCRSEKRSSSLTGVRRSDAPVDARDGEPCLSYVCESGHVFSWSPKTQRGLEREGGGGGGSLEMEGGPGGGTSLADDPPRKQRWGVRAGVEGSSVVTTRSRSGAHRKEMRSQTAQGPADGQEEEEEEEEVCSAPSTGTGSAQEDSGQVETDTGNVAVTTGCPEPSQPCTDSLQSPKVTKTTPQKKTETCDLSRHTNRPTRRTTRTSVSYDEVPLTGSKRKRKANPKEILLCTYEGCEKIFSSRQYLNHHMKYQHILQRTFSCSHVSCGKAFNFKKHLKEHEKLHSNQRDYICEFCARAFRTNSNLIIHRRIHTGEKPLQCEVCGFTCCQKASLNWHMKKHNAESSYQFPCDICGRRFEKRDNVTSHRSKSHPEHPATTSPDLVTSNDLLAAPSLSVSEEPE